MKGFLPISTDLWKNGAVKIRAEPPSQYIIPSKKLNH